MSGSKMVVKLSRPVNKRVPGDLVISLCAYLVDRGHLPAEEESILEGLHCPPYIRRAPMSLNAELDVVVTQVDSGHKIWVQETDNGHLMETVDQVLQREYVLAWEHSDLEVLVPFPGLRCITRYQTPFSCLSVRCDDWYGCLQRVATAVDKLQWPPCI